MRACVFLYFMHALREFFMYVVADPCFMFADGVLPRNMYVSANGTRTWVEITEPIMKSYVAWKSGAVCDAQAVKVDHAPLSGDKNTGKRARTDGFNDFLTGLSLPKNRQSRVEEKGRQGACKQHGAQSVETENVLRREKCKFSGRRDKQAYFFNPFL
jgi:hypothetical protein